MKKLFFLLVVFGLSCILYEQNAYAVTVYPGTIIANPITNYTADQIPNFNVTSINATSSHIYLGTSFYDLSRTGSAVNANITNFNEAKNATFKITNTNVFPITMKVLGQLQQVKLDGTFYPYGINWSYSPITNQTTISVKSHTQIFVSWTTGPITVNFLHLSGAIFGATAYFNQPSIYVNTPGITTVSEIGLFNTNGLLYDHVFSPPITVTAGQNVTLPYKFNDTNTGLQKYTLEAIVNNGTGYTIAISNQLTLYFGSFTPGNLNLNQTNPLSVSFRFVRTDLNTTTTDVDVYYPSTFNSTCNLIYQQEQTNHTYDPLPSAHATFTFVGATNDVVDVNCRDKLTNATGTYVLTQSNFPLVEQIKQFRAGEFGTSGKFGAFDLVTLIALIVSILGFNRVNESVGAIINTTFIGLLAFLGIIAWPVILSSSVALVLVLVISSTRKTVGY